VVVDDIVNSHGTDPASVFARLDRLAADAQQEQQQDDAERKPKQPQQEENHQSLAGGESSVLAAFVQADEV
jgi:hypothetical protein